MGIFCKESILSMDADFAFTFIGGEDVCWSIMSSPFSLF
jgi:hypothetical protein